MSNLKAGRPSAGKKLSLDAFKEAPEAVKRVNFDLPESQHKLLKKYAVDHNTSIRELLSRMVADLLADR